MGASQPPPSIRKEDWNAIVRKHDKEFDKPEVVYRFSNDVEKISTDRTKSGIYGLTGGRERYLANENGRLVTTEDGKLIRVHY